MTRIYKYPIGRPGSVRGEYFILIPVGAKHLSVQYQEADDCIVLWAAVDNTKPAREARFTLRFTGEPIPADRLLDPFLGTCQCANGIVVHVFVNWSL